MPALLALVPSESRYCGVCHAAFNIGSAGHHSNRSGTNRPPALHQDRGFPYPALPLAGFPGMYGPGAVFIYFTGHPASDGICMGVA